MGKKESERFESPFFRLLGGQGCPTHFAPANGFPPETYIPLLRPLFGALKVCSLVPLPMRTTMPPPPRLTWHDLADETVQHLEAAGCHGLIGLGHSLGGVTSVLAAVKRPGLFRALVLMDPVIFPQRLLWLIRLLRALGQEHRLPLVRSARRRRRVFSDRENVRRRYGRHPFFAAWDREAFEAYIRYGFRRRADGQVELAYDPTWEAAIFASVPTDIWQWLPRVDLPTLVLYGERSDTFRPPALRRLQHLWPQAHFSAVSDSGHMFPLERPLQTARLIQTFVSTLECPP